MEQTAQSSKRQYPFAIENPIEENRPQRFLDSFKNVMDVDIYRLPMSLYLETCARCNNCAKTCHIYQTTGETRDLPAYRSELLRGIHNKYFTRTGRLLGHLVGARELDEETIDQLLESVYRCSMCRRCNLECPMGIDNALVARIGRVVLSYLNLAPKNFTVSVSSQLSGKPGANTSAIPREAFIDTLEFLNEEIEEATGKKDMGFPIDKVGAEALFTAPVSDYMMEADTLIGNAIALNAAGADWTVGTEFNDAINYGLFYSDDVLAKVLGSLLEQAKKLKVKKLIIGECGHATKTAKIFTNLVDKDSEFQIENILEFTARAIREGKIKLNPEVNTDPVTYHDPCNLARMGGVIKEPREILRAAAKNFVEMQPHGHENYCCGGGGGGVTVPDIHEFRMKVAGKKKAEQIRNSGAKLVAGPCANCKKQLRELVEFYKLPVTVIGVHDLLIKSIVL